ncbi:MAG: polysaccharide biosynthesis C-terminal domain-containing protein [Candidatus Nanoarchaeia archaeon]|nr:polysaccharide biosynthesis C-terminal domain-containing protein [Candidatus Nanoarchaeia archaeon]
MNEDKKQTIYAFLLNGASKFVTYLLLLILANLYAINVYGESAFIMAFFDIITFFVVIGLPYIFVPWVINKKEIYTIFYFLLILNLILIMIGSVITIFKPVVFPLVIALPFVLFYNFGSSFLRIDHKYGLVQFFNVFLIFVTLIFAFVFKEFNQLGIIGSYALGYIIPTFFIVYITKNHFKNIFSKFNINYKIILEYFKKGIIVSLIILSFNFLSWIDSSVLGIMSTFENVARYNISMKLSSVIPLIPLALSMFLLTRTSELQNHKVSLNVLKRTMRISYFISLLGSVTIVSFLPLIIKFFFPAYSGIELYTSILITGVLFYTVYFLEYTSLTGKLEPEKAFIPLVSSALLNLILDILLVPQFGIYGICFATMLANMLAFTLLTIQHKIMKEFIWVYLLSFIVLLAYYLGYYGLILIPILVPLLFLLKLIHLEDIKVIKETIFGMLHIKI